MCRLPATFGCGRLPRPRIDRRWPAARCCRLGVAWWRRIARVVGMLAFESVLERGSGGGAYIVVPDEVLADLGRGGRFRARGRLSDVEFRSSTMSIGGGRVCLGVHKATRKAAGVDFGDVVIVEIEPDDDPGRSEVLPELSQALDRES